MNNYSYICILFVCNEMNEKENRKKTIADLINSQKIHTQDELIKRLEEKGIAVTQATLSRDIKELGAVKVSDPVDGLYYRIQSIPVLKSHFTAVSVELSGQMCVIRVKPGFASPVAAEFDEARVPGVMGTIAGDDTVLVILREDADKTYITNLIKAMYSISNIEVRVAGPQDFKFAEAICEEIYISSQERKTGIARRTPEYIKEKMSAGKAVIAVSETGEFAGFSYIESWGGKSFVANSGLIVSHKFRGLGIARRIKEQTFLLSRTLFPDAKIFSISTGAAVMKMNYEFGFRPVPFSELTDDSEFWKGCEGCRHFEILKSHNYNMCICTGLLYDPNEHLTIHHPSEK